jgi:hypothetical protein
MARSPIFDGVDPRLVNLIQQVGGNYGPYGMRMISGARPGSRGYHGKNRALDVELFDRKTGAALENYQDPTQFGAYQQFANQVYAAADPELQKQLRWGGYFSGGKDKYGALDLMHFDLGGLETPMGGGSWAGGLTPEQAAIWGLQSGGGATGGGGDGSAAPGWNTSDPNQQWMQGLWADALRASQTTGLDPRLIMAQTALETGYGKHVPDMNYFGIKGGSGAPVETTEVINGKTTRVMDRFRGYKSAQESFDDYAKFMMGDRYKGTREAKGLEAQIAELAKSGYATDPEYGAKLLKIAQGIPYGAAGGASGGSGTGTPATGPTAPAKPADAVAAKSNSDAIGESIKDMVKGFGGGSGSIAPPLQTAMAKPVSAAIETQPGQMLNPELAQASRDKLAMAMARLNSGKLFVG